MHKDSNECEINFSGNSGEMEKMAAEVLFMRSEERVKLRYSSLLGDGDTKTIKHINEKVHPYGPGFVVTKEECVGHAVKRFKNRLKTARQTKQPNATGKLVSMQGGGGMTEETSRILTRYYKGAILNNTGDVDGMKLISSLSFIIPYLLMKIRIMNFVQKESTHGVHTINTSTKQQNIQTETFLCTNTKRTLKIRPKSP